MVTHYHLFIGHHSTGLKNKLQKDVKAYLESLSGKLFPAEDLETIKKKILERIDQLNQDNKRCQPMKITFSKSGRHGGHYWQISGFWAVQFYLYPTTLSHISTLNNK